MTAPLQEKQQQLPEEMPKPPSSPPVHSRKKMLLIVTGVLAALGLAWFLLWVFYLQYHESTDDAYANGNLVNINAAVAGTVIAFYADNTDLVKEGQLIVQLDPTYHQVAYEQALASLAATVLQVRQLYNDVFVNQANVNSKTASLSKTKFDYENRSALISAKAVSNEDYIHSRDDLTIAENELKKAEYQLQVSQAAVGNSPIESHPLIEEKKSEVRQAFYNLRHCEIYAPTTGFVAQRNVNVGQWVTLNTAMMAIIPKDYVWVDANFKETQLTYMRVGQPAAVWFDLYGSHVKYQGKVLGIASGSGSVFSLIPPQNATGNWIKIVQRLAVRISLDPDVVQKYPVRLGISAEVNVDITDQNLPMLPTIPSTEKVAATRVFDISMDEVNLLIDKIVSTNLNPLKKE